MPVPPAFSRCPLGTVSFELRATRGRVIRGSRGLAVRGGLQGRRWVLLGLSQGMRRQPAARTQAPPTPGLRTPSEASLVPCLGSLLGWGGAVTVETPTGTEPRRGEGARRAWLPAREPCLAGLEASSALGSQV